MTREVYNMLSEVLDDLEEELRQTKEEKIGDSEGEKQTSDKAAITIKLDVTIRIE